MSEAFEFPYKFKLNRPLVGFGLDGKDITEIELREPTLADCESLTGPLHHFKDGQAVFNNPVWYALTRRCIVNVSEPMKDKIPARIAAELLGPIVSAFTPDDEEDEGGGKPETAGA